MINDNIFAICDSINLTDVACINQMAELTTEPGKFSISNKLKKVLAHADDYINNHNIVKTDTNKRYTWVLAYTIYTLSQYIMIDTPIDRKLVKRALDMYGESNKHLETLPDNMAYALYSTGGNLSSTNPNRLRKSGIYNILLYMDNPKSSVLFKESIDALFSNESLNRAHFINRNLLKHISADKSNYVIIQLMRAFIEDETVLYQEKPNQNYILYISNTLSKIIKSYITNENKLESEDKIYLQSRLITCIPLVEKYLNFSPTNNLNTIYNQLIDIAHKSFIYDSFSKLQSTAKAIGCERDTTNWEMLLKTQLVPINNITMDFNLIEP